MTRSILDFLKIMTKVNNQQTLQQQQIEQAELQQAQQVAESAGKIAPALKAGLLSEWERYKTIINKLQNDFWIGERSISAWRS